MTDTIANESPKADGPYRIVRGIAIVSLFCHCLILLIFQATHWVPWIKPHKGIQFLICLIGVVGHSFVISWASKPHSPTANFWDRQLGWRYLAVSVSLLVLTLLATVALLQTDYSHPSYIETRRVIESHEREKLQRLRKIIESKVAKIE